jgi:hypothetical protein
MLPLVLCRVVLFHADVNKLLMYARGNKTYVKSCSRCGFGSLYERFSRERLIPGTVRTINGSVIVVITSGGNTYTVIITPT